MKRIVKKISKNRISYELAIRSRKEIVIILLKVIKLLKQIEISSESENQKLDQNEVFLIIKIEKMGRVFLATENQIQSFHFPFELTINETGYSIMYKGYEITNVVISFLTSIFDEWNFNDDMLELYDTYVEKISESGLEAQEEKLCSDLVIMLLTFELGYLRYDLDDNPSRVHPQKHPKNHIDINLTNKSTFKLGLNHEMEIESLEDLLDLNTNCYFLHRV